MIYLVTRKQELFSDPDYTIISPKEAVELMQTWKIIQYDSETEGRDPHLCKLLCAQFGNDAADTRIVVDCETVNIKLFKYTIEEHLIIGHNLKFDLQFLYNYGIIPRKVYDTMIVEQLLYLGYPPKGKSGGIGYSLHDVAERRLGINIDKTVRGEIIWRGLDKSVIMYAAGDVTYLEQIMKSQVKDYRERGMVSAAKLECDFVPVIAYMEWCGVKLDVEKWKEKMEKDKQNLDESIKALNDFVLRTPVLSKYVYIEKQGDLFEGFDTSPRVNINWASAPTVTQVFKLLGFNVSVIDKKSGEDKESAMEKVIKGQKGINDEFVLLYFGKGEEGDDDYYPGYSGSAKVVSSFGQGHLNAINPITGRIHTTFKQLGAASGRMSCGSTQANTELEHYKHLPKGSCKYPNLQQLPHGAETRSCFIAEDGNNWVSCDWSAAEARLAGDIYNDQAIKDIFLKGIDSHSMYAKIFFKDDLADIDVHDVKKKRPDLRQLAKGPEFALNFGGGLPAIMSSLQCSKEYAEQILKNYEDGFKGTAEFAKRGSKFVQTHGYVLMCPLTGHKMYWWDWDKWKATQAKYNSPDWDWNYYRIHHKNTGDAINMEVKTQFKIASKWDRMARNAPTQGTCAVMLKHSQIQVFNWVVEHGYFGQIKLCVLVHDESNWEYPKEIEEFPNIVKQEMEKAAAIYCKSLPIPADAAVGDHWIHE